MSGEEENEACEREKRYWREKIGKRERKRVSMMESDFWSGL